MADGSIYLTADLRAAAGISRTTLDYYLREGLITPAGHTETGFLYFRAAERDRLLRLVELRRQGHKLKTITALLAEEPMP